MSGNSFSRRSFLMTSSSLLVAAAAGQAFSAESRASKTWTVACRDVHLKETKAADVWAACQAIGVNALEINVEPDLSCSALYHPSQKYSIATPESITILKDDLQKNNVRATSFLMATQFDSQPEESLQWCAKVVDASKELGARAIRIDVVPGKLRGKRDEFLKFSIEMGKKLVALVEDSRIRFGIENHGDTTNDPTFLHDLFEGVQSPKLGITLDTANFYWFGHPLEKLYEIFQTVAPYACHTHCKSIKFPDDKKNEQRPMGWEYGKYNCPVYAGDIDFARLVKILHEAGYTGDLCIENESLGKFPEAERGDVLRKEVEFLQKLV